MIGRLAIFLLALAAFAAPSRAQEPDAALRGQAERVVALLRGEAEPETLFTPAFLAQVPAARVRAIGTQLAAQYGAPQGLAGLTPRSPTAGTIRVDFARATVVMDIQIDPQPPHRINGLLVTGAEMRDDSLAAVLAELRALPGQTSIAVARLGDGAPVMLAGHEPDRILAIGSTFKLFILAELSRQIRAGERRWSDVVPLDRRSIPSGMLQNWPPGSPLTLHSLAALMISISDNTATDILLRTLGRGNVERMMTTLGVAAAERNQPLLSTLEMAAIKTGGAAGLATWRTADAGQRRRLLRTTYASIDASRIDPAAFSGNPNALDIEWFASAADLVRVMDWLRRSGDETALALLAINPVLGAQARAELAYVGFKGGSEPGVLSLTWLVRNRAGAWHVVTGSWNNPAAPIEESRLIGLLARAIRLVRQD